MFKKYVMPATLVVAIVGLAGAMVGCGSSTPNFVKDLHAQFESAPNFAGAPFCPAKPPYGPVLVEGRGIGTAFIGPIENAVGTAAECSRGVILHAPGYHAPNTGQFVDCDNNDFLTGKSWFDVHGTGTYTVKDGSVLFLTYHEHSESPFQADGKTIRKPPFTLHDCGFWQVDPNRSTGTFHGSTGSGTIKAFVPVRLDLSAPVSADYLGKIKLVKGASPPAAPSAVACDKVMTGPITGAVTVASGAVCTLEAASVNGGVTVDKGGSLLMQNTIASGDVVCNGCGAPTPPPLCTPHLCGGAVNFMNSTTLGSLTIDGSVHGSTILSNFVAKDLEYSNSSGNTVISGNYVLGSLTCDGNTPPPAIHYTPPGQTFKMSNYPAKSEGQCTT